MNITGVSSGFVPAATQSARTALALLTPRPDAPSGDRQAQTRSAAPARESSMEALLRYAKVAKSLAQPKQQESELLAKPSGGGTDSRGYARSELLSLDQIEPEYAREWGALGVTHVVRLTPPELSDEEFQVRMSAALDDMYADDPAYLAARADGAVLIKRMSDIEAEVPGFKHNWSSFEFYRGNEYIGGGAMGIPSPAFERFWADQNAAGTYVMLSVSFVARWPMAARQVAAPQTA